MRLSPASTADTAETRDRALAAPVGDPLWLLARQWQTRGFIADDAGTPVHVRLAPATAPLLFGGPDGAPVTAGLEPLVEAEPRPTVDGLDHARLVELGTELARRLRAAGAPGARAALAATLPFAPAGAGPTIRPFVGRIPDPRTLYHLLVPALGPSGAGGRMPALPGIDPKQAAPVETACRTWLAWLAPRLAPPIPPPASAAAAPASAEALPPDAARPTTGLAVRPAPAPAAPPGSARLAALPGGGDGPGEPGGGDGPGGPGGEPGDPGGGTGTDGPAEDRTPVAWDPARLEYRFALAARLPEAALKLTAGEYDGGGIEWYTLDDAGLDPHGGTGVAPLPVEVRPAPVAYPGMPRPRFWELEDGDVNLDTIGATDPAHAVLVAFAHQYANDWFLVPLQVPAGVTSLHGFTVTDTFGGSTEVPAVAALDGGRGPWRMWELTSTGENPAAGAGGRVLVPPTPAPASGEVLEDVLVVRDEMANLAWVIERTTRDADGRPVDRFQRHLRLRPPADPAFDPADQPDDRRRYRLGTAVPDFWYPLVTTTGADGRPLLARAALPPGATGVPDDGVRGELIPHGPATVIADEEVPREGAHVTRQDRLTTGGPGVIVWRARTKAPGLGEASSGLRFDTLE